MKRRQPLRVEVIESPQPIDLRAWVRVLLREILTMNGIPVRDEVSAEPEPLRKAS